MKSPMELPAEAQDAKPVVVDIAGQIGGPSLEEQERVDMEQRAIMAAMKAARAPLEAAEKALLDRKLAAHEAKQKERRDMAEAIKSLTARVAALEARK